jgi:hypothetical protein
MNGRQKGLISCDLRHRPLYRMPGHLHRSACRPKAKHVKTPANAMKTARLSFELDASLQNIPGMPQERLARVAARRVFVEMKQCFMQSASGLQGASAALLQRQLRIAGDVGELLELSDTLLAVLPPDERKVVRRQLDAAFPMAGRDTEFVPL